MAGKAYLMMYCCIIFLLSVVQTCYSTEIKLGILLPEADTYPFSIKWVLPALEIAIEKVLPSIVPGINVLQEVKNSNCSMDLAPKAAVDLYAVEHVHVFIGPFCDYAVAPVARFSPHWNIPVLSAGALAADFKYEKSEFKLLTRVHGTNSNTVEAFVAMANSFNWTNIAVIHFEKNFRESACRILVQNLLYHLRVKSQRRPWVGKVKDTNPYHSDIEEILHSASLQSRMCGVSYVSTKI
ncbi:atrial natriuretic peptide receptor 3-like [Mercenaria mercenaria]|uniref:atrial natriuretic peptide receptor 3-like n=1 Tax=Mercenaria mercenaria TaxID=6596 RepID=UPI00234ED7F4|nr:atrial natriuretic peptide receptor 3-like [Mercenaria mercenaria]